MRRMLTFLTIALLIAAPFAATAQQFPSPANPTIVWSNASITAANTSSEVSLFQYTIPGGLIATSSVVPSGTNAPTYLSNANAQTWQMYGPQPLHFRAIGTVGGAATSTVNLGISLGGTNATVTINNIIPGGITPGLVPARLDVYIIPIATTTATPTSNNTTMFLYARFEQSTINGATASSANTIGTFNLASPTQLNVVAKWAAAANTSSLNINQRILRIGE